ncbi:PEGA domain-containing protein [Shewanella algae]|uniref:PEGA domain-containing protein n=1 Tax=Shewanella algae TaxID=38313 RepID=UPI001183B76A|nr:PEGA domain-containing protein [Shewanella algae]MBO2663873.1 PEGA domain-containing protein [Shewanella algae]MCL1055550.1 PEGA domain-containing protein [Shewanella algae]TVO89332.1 hypothetical protein AYI80_11700 [Shewanella algae]TXS85791.1 hypothetical protein AYI81_14225 [Shewanella algae]
MKKLSWRVFFLLLSAAYLIPEAIFNAQLVSLVGLGTPKPEQLEHLEIYGRTISGIGVTLLLADLLPARLFKTGLRGSLTLLLLTLCVWPSVFFGQKYLIEQWLIEPSTPEQRQYAAYSAALRDALAVNAVEVEGLNYDPKELHSSENLTFLALFGGLAYADHNLTDNLDDYKQKIIHNFVQKRAYRDFDQHYHDFGQLYDELSASYRSYAEGSNRYNQTLAGIPEREMGYWQNIEQEVNQGWGKYQQAQKAHVAKAGARAQEYGPKIFAYHEDTNRCQERYKKSSQKERRYQCIERENARYKTMISKAGLGYIDPNYWLIVEDISTGENLLSSALFGVMTAGVGTAMQALSLATGGDGGLKDKRYKYTDDPDHYQRLFLVHPKFQAMFEKETGYPFNIGSLADFRVHPVTQVKLRRALKAKGLKLPDSWHISNRPLFSQSVAKTVKAEADARWQSEMRKRGLDLPINLSWNAFQLHPQIQRKIAARMGDLYVPNVRADWNQANFKRHVLDPNIQKRTQSYLQMLAESEREFADGGRYAEQGKQALRSVIIPPISMSLSLFLICMTFIKLPLKTLQLFRPGASQASASEDGTGIDENATESAKSGKRRWLALTAKLLPPLLLLTLPVLLVQNRYTQDDTSPVNYFLTKVEQSGNIGFAYALRWTLHAQPLLHPLGLSFEQHTGIYQAFSPLAHSLAKIDLLHKSTPAPLKASELAPTETRLKVETNVNNANIRIMNIGPKYHPGIRLKPGNYDVQVSAPGYQTYRKWHSLNGGEQTLTIRLLPH